MILLIVPSVKKKPYLEKRICDREMRTKLLLKHAHWNQILLSLTMTKDGSESVE